MIKFFDQEMIEWMQKSIHIEDTDELFCLRYDTVFIDDIYMWRFHKRKSLLVYDMDNQALASFVFDEEQCLKNIRPFEHSMTYFKFEREIEKFFQKNPYDKSYEAVHIVCHDIAHKIFGLYRDGKVEYFFDKNQWHPGTELQNSFYEYLWAQEKPFHYKERVNLETEVEIVAWLDKNKVENYTIGPDLRVDVHGSVTLKDILMLPVTFGEISGDFIAENSRLENLQGFPSKVQGKFSLYSCGVCSLKGGPDYVAGDYYISSNFITSLEGCPRYIGNNFKVFDNRITTLDYLPSYVGGHLEIRDLRMKKIPLAKLDSIDYPGLLYLGSAYPIKYEKMKYSRAEISHIALQEKLEYDMALKPVHKHIKI